MRLRWVVSRGRPPSIRRSSDGAQTTQADKLPWPLACNNERGPLAYCLFYNVTKLTWVFELPFQVLVWGYACSILHPFALDLSYLLDPGYRTGNDSIIKLRAKIRHLHPFNPGQTCVTVVYPGKKCLRPQRFRSHWQRAHSAG
jgi:hypothetical protein